MKKLLTLLLTGIVSVCLTACGTTQSTNSDSWEKYKQTQKITIGFDNTFVPMGFEDEQGNSVGFDIDLAEAVFKKYNINVVWQPINWELKEDELTNGNIDLIWNGYTITPERANKVLFTNPYMKSSQALVSKKDSHISSHLDMTNKILGAQSGSSGYHAFLNTPTFLKDIIKDNDAILYDTFTQAFLDLETNRIDSLLVDDVYANYYLTKNGKLNDYTVIQTELESGDFAVGARKEDTTLVSKINTAFIELYQDGTYQTISKKWFGEDTATKEVKGN